VTSRGRRAVFDKTQGHCHFCVDELLFDNYGPKRKPYPPGAWELDHVIQRKKGGVSTSDNYLPACKQCNHLRWHRSGSDLRRLILLGLVANDEIRADTELGRAVNAEIENREAKNKRRQLATDGEWPR
jgi:5-methylcytosine-specific restriction endonuclease McrA